MASSTRAPSVHRYMKCTVPRSQKSMEESSILDGLEATSRWRKGQLSKIADNFEQQGGKDDKQNKTIVRPTPMEINCDDEVQPMWKEMESRVTRRKSMTLQEAHLKGKQVGRSNIRKTDEETWLEAGLYNDDGKHR